jgi:hypothetical protein
VSKRYELRTGRRTVVDGDRVVLAAIEVEALRACLANERDMGYPVIHLTQSVRTYEDQRYRRFPWSTARALERWGYLVRDDVELVGASRRSQVSGVMRITEAGRRYLRLAEASDT